jgi:hypothetical protein
MIKQWVAGFGIVLLVLVSCAFAYDDEQKAKATAEAQQWLTMVDSKAYDESWENAGTIFKAAVKKDQWIQMLEGGRTPLGKVISREITSSTFTTAMPGAPDGDYLVIEYATSFENKKSATETVTPMREPDGRWRVSGYYIK